MNIANYRELIQFLRHEGYREVQELFDAGDFAVRGDTVLVWPAGSMVPQRFHFLGESLERAEELSDDGWQALDQSKLTITANSLETTHGMIYPGDYVVHPYHGVGIFRGIIEQMNLDQEPQTYVALEYAGNDRLLIPTVRQEGLMPYIGARHPRLTRLNSKAWQHTKERVQKDLIHIARGLLKVFAQRQLHARPAYPPAPDWLKPLAASVPFTLTYDQDKALREIQRDLSTEGAPMDHLLCGDVGFGKTEVALRAAAQVLAMGKQVAFLAPTTILVEQHFAELSERFSKLPVRVEHISRLTKGADVSVKARIAEGSVDLVVGTHSLLRAGVSWHNLGLLIIDEEQKFGVSDKERLKHLRPNIDVLALSATPIPRTLSMSLSGLRGLSVLRHAPHGRLPVTTESSPFNPAAFAEAIVREVKRGGQVYVVHHRIGPLPLIAETVKTILLKEGLGDVRVEIAHGQLHEQELASRMSDFLKGKIGVLVASTIVEHGLDSALANTLIVLRSENFGLSDLYQLRGRVGRRDIQAYAYFYTGSIEQEDIVLERDEDGNEIAPRLGDLARKRLAALIEADTLGSGWSIAVRDLEIRGGGNILGHEQHGSMESIGLVLYGQLLQNLPFETSLIGVCWRC